MLNSKIQTIKKLAYGFQSREHFGTAIYFHCGGLNLYPADDVGSLHFWFARASLLSRHLA